MQLSKLLNLPCCLDEFSQAGEPGAQAACVERLREP
jgi:hypothetical protein